jgi:hypothetical protein
MERMLFNGYKKEALEECIELLDVPKDSCEFSYNMFSVFLSNLKSREIKEASLEILNNKVEKLKEKLKNTKNTITEYNITQDINYYIICILKICLSLGNNESGIKYFHKNYIELSPETKEYELLCVLEESHLINEWLKEYEDNMGKIEFRNSLNEKYIKFKSKKS